MSNRILPEQKIIGIQTPEDLDALADDLGVRPDWHEPDEQNVSTPLAGFASADGMLFVPVGNGVEAW